MPTSIPQRPPARSRVTLIGILLTTLVTTVMLDPAFARGAGAGEAVVPPRQPSPPVQPLATATPAAPRPTPTATSAAPPPWVAGRYFPIGMYEDANRVDAARFERMLLDLRARGFDTVLFTNNSVDRDAPLLDVSDRLRMNVIFSPAFELYRRWWPDNVPANRETARAVIAPLVDRLRPHPSLRGYNIIDDAPITLVEKIALATRTFQELDPGRPAMPTIVGGEHSAVYDAARPAVFLTYVYPVGVSQGICDFTYPGWGPEGRDFITHLRAVTAARDPNTPLWLILQAHGLRDWGRDMEPTALREPTVEEVRLQTWLALGEGAQGIFWFIYTTQQFWVGLVDNPPLYAEVTTLARRIGGLRGRLAQLHRTDDRFFPSGNSDAYASSFASADGARLYVIAVNRDCRANAQFSLASPLLTGRLRDVETGQVFGLGEPIDFGPASGRLLEYLAS